MDPRQAIRIMRRVSKAISQAVDTKDAPLLTVKETAVYLHCHTSTIYRMANAGQLPAFRIGSDWRFNKAKLDAWMEALIGKPTST